MTMGPKGITAKCQLNVDSFRFWWAYIDRFLSNPMDSLLKHNQIKIYMQDICSWFDSVYFVCIYPYALYVNLF